MADEQTPSQRIVMEANRTYHVTDARGRVIGFRKLLALDKMRVAKMVGSSGASNEMYLGYCWLAACVTEIDGEKLPPIANEREMEAMIGRLDDDGVDAVGIAVAKESGMNPDGTPIA